MTAKADLIAAIQVAADAYYLADPVAGAAVKIALGSSGTRVTIGDQEYDSGKAWSPEPKSIPTMMEGVAAYLSAVQTAKINELCNQLKKLIDDYNAGTVPTSATPVVPIPLP